jgi:hypothetical protein
MPPCGLMLDIQKAFLPLKLPATAGDCTRSQATKIKPRFCGRKIDDAQALASEAKLTMPKPWQAKQN